jgi:hypothetical protein
MTGDARVGNGYVGNPHACRPSAGLGTAGLIIFHLAMEFAFNRPPESVRADDSYRDAPGGVFS